VIEKIKTGASALNMRFLGCSCCRAAPKALEGAVFLDDSLEDGESMYLRFIRRKAKGRLRWVQTPMHVALR
jgi:hypothetical protein